jgi:ABC-2 type transport system ATP-binding protein
MTALTLEGVSHVFGSRRTPLRADPRVPHTALKNLTIRVNPGEVVAMIGLNGAGKTTALRILTGRLRPDAGIARVLDHDPVDLPAATAARFGHMVNAPLVYDELTVTENIVAAGRLHGLGRADAVEASTTAVGQLALAPWATDRAHNLSQGNRQRLGIACATVHCPDALVLDEPTSALDPGGVVIVRDLLRGLAENAAVLVSSHHLDEVSRVADRIVAVHGGRVVGHLEPGGTELERRFFDMVYEADRADNP